MPSPDPSGAGAVHREAMRLWWERERQFPRFTWRAPDALDVTTGAWGRVVAKAAAVLAERGVRPTEATG